MAESLDRAALADVLQTELQDLLCLAIVGDHVRWVLAGDEVAGLEGWLIDATAQWREWADQVAKRLVALGVAPDGRVRSLAKDIPTNWVPDGWLQFDDARRLLGDRLSRVSSWARDRRLYAEDKVTEQLLETVCSGLETHVEHFRTSTDHLV
jgi:starvation-inducible DNA-binding protein